MGGCLNSIDTNNTVSLNSLPAIEVSYLGSSSSSLGFIKSRNIIVKSPRISQLAQYFCTDKVIQASGNGFFSSLSAVTVSATPTLTEVTSELLLGSLDDAMNEAELRSKRVTHIISLIGQKNPIEGMQHKHMPMDDYGRTNLKCLMAKLSEFVEESQQPNNTLFIHCMSGQNRSATVCLAILMKYQGLYLYQAYKKVKNKRPVVQINERYGKQLINMEQELFGKTTLPENWMQIDSVDMDSGMVCFIGDSVSPISNSIHTAGGFKILNYGSRTAIV